MGWNQQEIIAIYAKAGIDIKNNSILAALVGNTVCRVYFECGWKSVLNFFVLLDFCKSVLNLGMRFRA